MAKGAGIGLALLAVLAAAAVGVEVAEGGRSPGRSSAAAAVVLPTLPRSDSLGTAAAARAEGLCDGGPDPGLVAARYRAETWVAVAELVGTAPIGDDGEAASRASVETGWAADPALGERWDRRADADVRCDDGRLAVVTVLARSPGAADAGAIGEDRSSSFLHSEAVRYGRARGVDGRDVDLVLDLDRPSGPPPDRARPALVLVHGGGFAAGSREMHAADARAYARRGFVVASIDYRLDPDAGASPEAHRAAAVAALADARDAVRWLRSHAEELGVDPDRIAALGASAGGEVALGLALLTDDPSASVAAAVSTGAYLTPQLGQARLGPGGAPVLLQFFEHDTASRRPWTYAAATCDAVHGAGGTCDLDVGIGKGHTVGLGPASTEADTILAFLAVHLDLAGDR